MFDKGTAYQKQARKKPSLIILFYTTKEIMEKYKICESMVYQIAKKTPIPKELRNGKTYWSQKHIDAYFRKQNPDANIKDWYSTKEIMDNMEFQDRSLYFGIQFQSSKEARRQCYFLFQTTH